MISVVGLVAERREEGERLRLQGRLKLHNNVRKP
jgi:hypothetical protein